MRRSWALFASWPVSSRSRQAVTRYVRPLCSAANDSYSALSSFQRFLASFRFLASSNALSVSTALVVAPSGKQIVNCVFLPSNGGPSGGGGSAGAAGSGLGFAGDTGVGSDSFVATAGDFSDESPTAGVLAATLAAGFSGCLGW